MKQGSLPHPYTLSLSLSLCVSCRGEATEFRVPALNRPEKNPGGHTGPQKNHVCPTCSWKREAWRRRAP